MTTLAERNPVSAIAYERKTELGGGFRAVVIDRRSGQRDESPILPDINSARHWARVRIDSLMRGEPWVPGYSYKPYWALNVWTR